MVLRTNANGKIGVSQITVNELNGLSGIKDNIQNQLNSKANASTAITTGNLRDYIVITSNTYSYNFTLADTRINVVIAKAGYIPIAYNLYHNYSSRVLAGFEEVYYNADEFIARGFGRFISDYSLPVNIVVNVVWIKR
ncbi:MAG: hypothetical protein HDT40_08295 [Lachnospiraceae bacterium]|nr:hypothetical protein [Lachnospiraceae bacterium]